MWFMHSRIIAGKYYIYISHHFIFSMLCSKSTRVFVREKVESAILCALVTGRIRDMNDCKKMNTINFSCNLKREFGSRCGILGMKLMFSKLQIISAERLSSKPLFCSFCSYRRLISSAIIFELLLK